MNSISFSLKHILPFVKGTILIQPQTQREATTDEVISLRRENDDLKKILAETFLKYEQFKKTKMAHLKTQGYAI